MKLSIVFSGQIAHAAGRSAQDIDVETGTSIEEVLSRIASGLPAEAARFLADRTLLVALDGQHVIDRATTIPEQARELLVMSPMSGG